MTTLLLIKSSNTLKQAWICPQCHSSFWAKDMKAMQRGHEEWHRLRDGAWQENKDRVAVRFGRFGVRAL